MKTKFLWSLAVLNAALLAMLLYRGTADNTAHAQAVARQRPATVGDVIMIPGQLPSGNNSIIYLIDVGNHQLSAMSYSGQGVDFLSPPVDLDRLFERTGNVGNGGAGVGPGAGTGVGPGATGTRGGTRMR